MKDDIFLVIELECVGDNSDVDYLKEHYGRKNVLSVCNTREEAKRHIEKYVEDTIEELIRPYGSKHEVVDVRKGNVVVVKKIPVNPFGYVYCYVFGILKYTLNEPEKLREVKID